MTRTVPFLLILWASACAFNAHAQNVLLQEDFENGLPSEWSQQTLATDGGWLSGTSNELESQWWPIAPHGQIVATNDDGCDCDKSEDYLITPELDLGEVEGGILAFSSYFDGGEYGGLLEEAFIEYSLDQGETWSVLHDMVGTEDGAWDFEVINLDAVIGETSVHLAFRYNDQGGWLFGWGIDDVAVLEPGGLDLALTGLDLEPLVEAPTTEDLTGNVINLGADSVFSYTIAWAIGSESGETTVDGVALGLADQHTFSLADVLPFEVSGNYTVSAEIISVNGTADDIASNNQQTADVTAILYATFPDGKELREYYYYHPSTAPDNCPLVFVFHGYTGDAEGMIQFTGFNTLADEYGFAVCYPEGSEDSGGDQFWNVGYAFHQNETVDDLGFTSSLRQHLIETHGLDGDRVFGTGFSNGADFCYMLACESSSEFRAVAPIAGILMSDIQSECSPEYMVPILEVHGTQDNVSLYDGDLENVDGWGAYPSTPDAMAFFVDLFGISLVESGNFPDVAPWDESTVGYQKWGLEGACPQVWLYTVQGGGHSWPGAWDNQDIEASLEAWQFFVQACSEPMSMGELDPSGDRTVVRVMDVLGREAEPKPGALLIIQYSDGSVEKRISGE